MENASKMSKVMELEEEIKKLSGQQNLQQRIHHHAKIKVRLSCVSIIFAGAKFNILTN